MQFIAKTLYGLEEVLAEELLELGVSDPKPLNRAVSFSGSRETMYRVNYCSRTTLSLLLRIAGFRIRSGEDLYRSCMQIEWSAFMNADSTFSVKSVVSSKIFKHTAYPGLIVKDAIADYFRKLNKRRPSVETSDPGVIVNLHISNDFADISLDTSGAPLFKRGYRISPAKAPLNEVLAAGILKISGWDASTPLIDPMCGSGTIPVEAGLMACRIPPGKFRKNFGFTGWNDFDRNLFEKIKREADKHIIVCPVTISASDMSEEAVSNTVNNVQNAGLSKIVTVEVSDFKDVKPNEDSGYLFMNPPYGQRLKPEKLDDLYSMIGSTLKHNFTGYRAWIISPGKEYLAKIGLKTKSKRTLYNGPLKCTLAEYELYHGTKKTVKC